jgi:hypothetical protein
MTPPLLPDRNFDLFWEAYPRKVAKKDARLAWEQTRFSRPSLAVLIPKIEELKRCDQWRRGKRWIPYPARWLRRDGWLDELEDEGPLHKQVAGKDDTDGFDVFDPDQEEDLPF